ncbi:hypothetical protein SD81_014870 [Tolypothrix campylonemoides VB511288]|nr:hypothetical protein SD81_014870 [Tolypothrix campylonemoides VB511288]
MKLPIQAQPINRKVSSIHNPLDGSNGVKPLFFCPFGCGLVDCNNGGHCVDTGFMQCECR